MGDTKPTPTEADHNGAAYWKGKYREAVSHARLWEKRSKANTRIIRQLRDENAFLRRTVERLSDRTPSPTFFTQPTQRKEQQP